MTAEEKLKTLMDTGEFDFVKKISKEDFWKLLFLAIFVSDKSEHKKGKWIFDGDCFICSKCKSAFNWWARSQCSNFCPNCGADMMSERRR